MEVPLTAAEFIVKANAAFVAEEYTNAAEYYTRAIQLDDTQSEYFLNRAHVLQKLDQYKNSLQDAEKAITLNPQDPKTFLRKGIACFHLGDYKEAREAFEQSSKIGGNELGIRQWLAWTDEKLLKAMPKESVKSEPVSAPTVSSVTRPQPVIKHDWYQTESHVCVTVLAKNLNPSQVTVNFSTMNMVMNAELPNDEKYSLNLNLSYPIVPDHSSFTVLKTKVEIKMKKCEGIRWNSLEGEVLTNVKQISAAPSAVGNIPVYPSSSSKKKDWDKIESQIKKEEEEEKPEGEAALNQLFQKIYTDGSDEIRRAMNKSFQESGGTVLSTNWNEVAKDKVTVKPPDGVEFKKWDE